MDRKLIFRDETYLINIWLNRIGLISMLVLLPFFLLCIVIGSGSLGMAWQIFLNVLPSLVFMALLFAFFAVTMFVYGIIFRVREEDWASAPILPVSDLDRVRDEISTERQQHYKYTLSLVLVLLVGLGVIIPALRGTPWTEALLNAAIAVFPFQAGFLSLFSVAVGLETIVLWVRYRRNLT